MGSSAIDRDVVLDVLLVEDGPGDALIITEALAEIDVRLHTVRDTGHESPLRGVHRYVRPDLAPVHQDTEALSGSHWRGRRRLDRRVVSSPVAAVLGERQPGVVCMRLVTRLHC